MEDNVARNIKISVFLLFGLTLITVISLGLWELIVIDPANADQRKNFAQTLAGTLGGIGAIVGLYFTWQTLKTNQTSVQNTQKNSQETLRLSQETQLVDRFTKAVDQLGNSADAVSLGGVHALERIAKDSEKDHWPVMEVLTAYVRGNSPWKEDGEDYSRQSQLQARLLIHKNPVIQAALTAVGRRARFLAEGNNRRLRKGEENSIDLRGTDLRRGNLHEAQLDRAWLHGAHLERADLSKAYLHEAFLIESHLEGASLREASLNGAKLQSARLEGAIFSKAELGQANFRDSALNGTYLQDVDLRYAAGLTQNQIYQANGDDTTVLPEANLRPADWWSKIPQIQEDGHALPPGKYSINALKDVAISFEIGEGTGWDEIRASWPEILRIKCGESYLSFLNARYVYNYKWQRLDSPLPAPRREDEMTKSLREDLRRYLTSEEPAMTTVGGQVGTRFDTVVHKEPKYRPTDCPKPCLPLFYISGDGRWFYLTKGYKNRVYVLDVFSREVFEGIVTIILESPEEEFDAFLLKAWNVLATVRWWSVYRSVGSSST